MHTGLGFETTPRRGGQVPASRRASPATNVEAVLTKLADDKALAKAYGEQLKVVTAFRDGLPEARRALANVATYMIFDDHEVTDDWNLSQRWKDKVYTSPLGRTVLRNGLVAYLVCQGWGNDPAAFATAGSKGKELLDAVPRLFPAGGQNLPDTATADAVDVILGLDGAEPPVRWDYRVDGPKHRVARARHADPARLPHRVSPPINLPTAGARAADARPARCRRASRCSCVVAPLPVFGLPVADELGGPLAYRARDVVKSAEIDAMPGTDPDAAEAWVNDKVVVRGAAEAAGAVPQGDRAVRRRPLRPQRRGQLLDRRRGVAVALRPVHVQRAEERLAPRGAHAVPVVRPHPDRSSASPVPSSCSAGTPTRRPCSTCPTAPICCRPPGPSCGRRRCCCPTHGWPDGTTVARPPDFAWRFRPARDGRPVAERPEPARPDRRSTRPARPRDATADDRGLPLGRQAPRPSAREGQLHPPGAVREQRRSRPLRRAAAVVSTAIHELHARPAGTTEPAIYTLHTVVLEPAAADPPEARPTIGTPR